MLIHTRTELMSADIYTKTFGDPRTWDTLRSLINVYRPVQLKDRAVTQFKVPGLEILCCTQESRI